MNEFIENFHLIRPLWLLAAIPAILFALVLAKSHQRHGQWHQFIPPHLARLLIDDKVSKQSLTPIITLVIIWLLSVVALSGPSWQKIPQPLFKVASAQVVVMDMSLSMYATDIKPNRLTRARFKVTDLIQSFTEGETGLVAFAGDAFVISPMTEDINNLLNLLPVLAPNIMPVYGSDPVSGIESAMMLFEQSHKSSGNIYLISDGITSAQQHQISQLLNGKNYQLHVLAIGGQHDAPIQLPSGELLKDANGNIVLPKLNIRPLQLLAKQFNGHFSKITQDGSDIDLLTQDLNSAQVAIDQEQQQQQFGDQWHEAGPYLLLLVLPLVAFAFRRGVIFSVMLIGTQLLFGLSTPPVFAAEATNTSEPRKQATEITNWDRLWINDDQVAIKQFKQQEFEQAASNFTDPQWQGASYYQQGDYEQALAAYSQSSTAQGLFNQGNSLMQMKRYQEAVERYQQALAKQPDLAAAQQNAELGNKLLKKQQNQKKQQSDGKNKDSDQQDPNQKNDSKSDNQKKSDDEKDKSEQDNGSEQDKQQASDEANQDGETKQDPSKDDNSSKNSDPSKDNSSEKHKKEQSESDKKAGGEQDNGSLTDQENQLADQSEIKKAPLFDPKTLSKEQRQRLQQLLKKVNDDPSLLLKNKMANEARSRRNQRVLNKDRVNW